MTRTRSEDAVNLLPERLRFGKWDICLHRSGKSAAVNAVSALSGEQPVTDCQRDRNGL